MALITLVDKSKLRALEDRCNSKELAEHVLSVLTITTMQQLPDFANSHFLRTFEYYEHLSWDGFIVLLDECRHIPNAFLSFDLDEWETKSMESMESSESMESEAIGDTTASASRLCWSGRTQVNWWLHGRSHRVAGIVNVLSLCTTL